MHPTPKISIQMCTYNRAYFIDKAINSVLSQTFQDWELLILDDKSTDNTEEIISKYLDDPRIRYIKNEENLGITKNRNKALTLSQGEYIAVLDSDDYWIDNTKLERQINFLNKHPDYVLVGTNFIVVDKNNNEINTSRYIFKNLYIRNLLIIKNPFCHSSVLYRKREIIDEGAYDEDLPIWEDYDLWLKLGIKYKLDKLKIYTTAYRVHDNQSNKEKMKVAKNTQKFIIDKYRKNYKGYLLAKIVDKLRNIRIWLKE